MAIKKITIEELGYLVLYTDGFNQDTILLDILHVLEIALKRHLGLNSVLDGAIDIDLGNGAVLRCQLAGQPVKTNAALNLCELAKPHLLEGSRLFTSKSIVVAVNDSQPLADRLSYIDFAIGQLRALRECIAEA
jgi:hypothetical protein